MTYEEWLNRHWRRWRQDAIEIVAKLETEIDELRKCPTDGGDTSWLVDEIAAMERYIGDVKRKTRGHLNRLKDFGNVVDPIWE